MTRRAEFTVVIEEGKRARTEYLDVRAVASPLSHPRVGLVVPKRGHTSVKRNRLKRQLRELVRVYVLQNASGMDIVIRARDEAYNAPFAELQRELVAATVRLSRALNPSG